jgi:hypothetical protein
MLPKARRDNLLIREIGDELVVYDVERHRSHSLTPTAALIWRLCDGRKTVAELTTTVAERLRKPVDEEVVWLVLNRLERAHLLRHLLIRPREVAGMTRRDAIALGLAGAAALLVQGCGVDSVTAPTTMPQQRTPASLEASAVSGRLQASPAASVPPPSPSPSPPPAPRCGPLSGDICDVKRGNLTKQRCQNQCNPGTPECQRVAPNDFCEGDYTGPTFKREVGNTRLFCRHCACVCGEFKPGR